MARHVAQQERAGGVTPLDDAARPEVRSGCGAAGATAAVARGSAARWAPCAHFCTTPRNRRRVRGGAARDGRRWAMAHFCAAAPPRALISFSTGACSGVARAPARPAPPASPSTIIVTVTG